MQKILLAKETAFSKLLLIVIQVSKHKGIIFSATTLAIAKLVFDISISKLLALVFYSSLIKV